MLPKLRARLNRISEHTVFFFLEFFSQLFPKLFTPSTLPVWMKNVQLEPLLLYVPCYSCLKRNMITLSFHSPTDETARAIIAPLLFTCTVLANRCYYHPSILPSYQQNQGNFDSTVTVNNGSDVACPTAPRGSNMTTTNRNSAGRCSSIASSPASDDSSIIAAPTKIAVSEAHSRPAPHEESTCQQKEKQEKKSEEVI